MSAIRREMELGLRFGRDSVDVPAYMGKDYKCDICGKTDTTVLKVHSYKVCYGCFQYRFNFWRRFVNERD